MHLAIGELFVGRLSGAQRRIEDLRPRYAKGVDGAYFARFLRDLEIVGGMVLSNVQWLTGFPKTAMRTALAAVERAQTTGHVLSLSIALAWLCPVFFWSGLYEQCRDYVTLLEEKALRHGIITWRPVARFYRGALACALGDAKSSGREDLQDALAELRAMNHMVRFPFYRGVLADELAKQGRLDDAERTIVSALGDAEAQSERWCVPELLRIRASILKAGGLTDQAEAPLLKSLEAAGEMGALSWRLRTANDLAKLWRGAERGDDARRLVQPIYAEFTEPAGTRDLAVAAELLDETNPTRRGSKRPDP